MGVDNPPNHAGQRSIKRSRVLLGAKLKTERGELDARLRDLSRKGALLECNEAVTVGEDVVFVRGETVVPARIAWVGGDRIGVEFLKPIHETEVLIHVTRGPATRIETNFRRPSFSNNLSDYDRKLARVLGASLGVRLIDD